jgi:uncharacterized membrane protein
METGKLKDLGEKAVSGFRNGKGKAQTAATIVSGIQAVKSAFGDNGNGSGGGGGVRDTMKGMADVVKGLSKSQGKGVKTSHIIQEHIDVAVPKRTAYNQWTQFKDFSAIMKGVEQAEQEEDDKLSFEAKIGPVRRKWMAEIMEQVPDQRIAWRSTGGVENAGVVSFHSLDESLTRVMVQMEYHPRGMIEHIGNFMRVQRRRVRRDLRLFKNYLELQGEESGAWRGRIARKQDLKEKGENSPARTSHRDERSVRSDGSRSSGSRARSSSRSKSNRSRSGVRSSSTRKPSHRKSA